MTATKPRRVAAQRSPPRGLIAAAGAAALVGALLAGDVARAAPATLANDVDVTNFAKRVKDYARASRVRWIVAARTHADAEALIATIGLRLHRLDLGEDEVRRLTERISAESFRDDPAIAPDTSIPVAWMAPQIGQSEDGARCSWQVWVKEPNAPSVDAGGVSVPLAPNDRLPVSPAATFRVGYAGLVQSKLYAFDETQPGAIRDLATAPDVNIPVATGPGVETIFLAMARQPVPRYEELRTALAASAGQRLDLGQDHTLRGTRNIGANFQLVAPAMVLAREDKVAAPRPDELTETCFFSLTPAPAGAQ